MAPPRQPRVPDLIGSARVPFAFDMRGTLVQQAIAELAAELAAKDPTLLARRPACRHILAYITGLAPAPTAKTEKE